MFDENPSILEDPLANSPAARRTPLVLIHDGGGTVFSYYCMPASRLRRRVYALANPHFHSGACFPGGIPEMARHYAALLRSTPITGDVLLGGWSLGGMVALEMARLLADQDGGGSPLRVVGIVMVDSVCPLSWQRASRGSSRPVQTVAARHLFGPTTRQETKDKVTRCFADAGAMVGRWTLPDWESDGVVPPPAVLLRAKESLPVTDGNGVARVDVSRDERSLGWDSYQEGFFCRVFDIPGHHFSLFSEENIDEVTDGLADACDLLEGLRVRGSSWRGVY